MGQPPYPGPHSDPASGGYPGPPPGDPHQGWQPGPGEQFAGPQWQGGAPGGQPPQKSTKGLLIGGVAVAAVLAIVLAVIVVAIATGGNDEENPTAAGQTTGEQAPADGESGEDPASGAEEDSAAGSEPDGSSASDAPSSSRTTTSSGPRDMMGVCTARTETASYDSIDELPCDDPDAYYVVFDKAPGNDPNRCIELQGGENVLTGGGGTWYCQGRNGFDRNNAINDAGVGDCIAWDDPGEWLQPKKVDCGSPDSHQVLGKLPDSPEPVVGEDTQQCIDAGYPDAAMMFTFGYAGGPRDDVGVYITFCMT